MILSDLQKRRVGDRIRVEAMATWEKANLPSLRLYAEVASEFADALVTDYDAFLAACALPALHFGERRILVEGDACPKMADGLTFVMEVMRGWYQIPQPAVTIEPKDGFKVRYPLAKPRAAMLFSGGVDALALLRLNRLNYPRDHPDSIRDGFLIEGFGIDGFSSKSKNRAGHMRQAVEKTAKDADVTLIPVLTNFVELNRDVRFYVKQWHGAVLTAITHLFANRITRISIASSYPAGALSPWGSHPMNDPYFSSSRLQVSHEGAHLSRLEKTRCLVGWDAALQNMRVCIGNAPDGINCGRCEKCVRTMTTLLALGRLRDCRAFPSQDVSSALLRDISISSRYAMACYKDLVDLLVKCERDDLATVLRRKIHYYTPSVHFGELSDSEWLRQKGEIQDDVRALLSPDQTIILVDDATFDESGIPGHRVIPFCHRDGVCEPPEDSKTAIAELEQLRKAGATFAVFVWPAYWWLDYYDEFTRHLQSNHQCVLENERMTIFDLRRLK